MTSAPSGTEQVGSLQPDLFPLGLTAVRKLDGACVLAKKQATGEPLVVKGLVGPRSLVSAHLDRLRAMVGLRHPAIVSVLEVGGLDNPAVVYEYFESRTLESFVSEHGALDWSLIPRWLGGLLPGMAAAAERSISIVGVNPSNLLISAQGEARLMNLAGPVLDFEGKAGLPGNFSPRDLQYRAPETMDYLSRPVDPRASLYGLGATMYYALTAAGPYESSTKTMRAIVMAAQNASPAAPSQARPAIPGPLSDYIMKLIDRDPGQRFATADEALAELANLRRALGG